MKKIVAYTIIDHGIDGEAYFPGQGVCHTEYEDVATGIGDTAAEALDDALESLAQIGWDTSSITDELDDKESVSELHGDDADELHWYVSVLVRGSEDAGENA